MTNKKLFIIISFILIFIIGISFIYIKFNKPNYVQLEFKEVKDFLYDEKIYIVEESDIDTIYHEYNYNDFIFIIYDTICDTALHIGFIQNDIYYSLCQDDYWEELSKDNWKSYLLNAKSPFESYENVLNTSGVYISMGFAANSNEVFYISVDNNINVFPWLLLSTSIHGDFNEIDFDNDGQKELVTNFDALIFKIKNDKLYSSGYTDLYDSNGNRINIFFDSENNNFIFYFYDKKEEKFNKSKIYYLDIKEEKFIEKRLLFK